MRHRVSFYMGLKNSDMRCDMMFNSLCEIHENEGEIKTCIS